MLLQPRAVVRVVDFRYHLVSTVAVFLALAIGIVVGTTTLNGPVLDDLNGRVSDLTGDKRALEEQLRAVQARSEAQEQAARMVGPGVVDGRLDGQRVVLVSTPDAPARLREDLLPLLRAAGAQVGATVRLRPALLDPASSQQVDDLVAQVAVPGAELPDGEPVERATAQLAQVLVRRPAAAAVPAATAQRVLAAYQAGDLIDVEGDLEEAATLAVVLTGGSGAGEADGAADGEADGAADTAADRTRVLLGLARDLDVRSGGTVLAGPAASAAEGGLVAALRDDGGVADRVSSVDAADTPTGRLAVVLALREQAEGEAGAYGSGAGADGVLPEAAD